MQQHRFSFATYTVAKLLALVESTATARGLQQQSKGELKSLPPNTHWHFKRAKQKGTFEVTLFTESHEVLIAVHDNRSSAWTGEEMEWWLENLK